MNTLSLEEFKRKYGEAGLDMIKKPSQPQPQQGFAERTKQSFKSGYEKIKSGFKQAGDLGDVKKKQSLLTAPLKGFEAIGKIGAGTIEAVTSPITAAAEPVLRPTVGRAVEFAADKISDIPVVQKFADSKAGDMTSRITENVANYNTIAGAVAGSKTLMRTPTVVENVATKMANTTDDLTSGITQKVQNMTEGARNLASPLVEEAKRIPSRIKTNVANKRAMQESINQLPSKVAREAAQDGLDINDVKTLYNIPKSQSGSLKKLAKVTKEFAEGNTKTNPIEVVGRPIVNRLKELETQRVKVGSKLGEIADKLGTVTKEELVPTVFQRLKKIPGLEGLSIDDAGNLNFKNTVLATAETASDRKAIQSIFRDATKWGSGKNKHLLRQELFESLGGKKSASLKLTATQERAYNAIRQGLSDVLEGKSLGYKNLSNQYRKIIAPIKEMRKTMKMSKETLESLGLSEDLDILDMSAGLLARRLTSLAPSNPQIRAILKAMDQATKKAGKTRLNVETLQDFYNILEKYYDVAPKTGFQAQVRQGVEKAATGPINYLADKVKGLAGETPAVRQQALEKILNEIFKNE